MYQIPRNSLALLLVSMGLVILPHVLRLPFWLTLVCVGCGLWRVMVFQGRWSYPGKWIKSLFVFGSFFAVGFGYGTLLGLEPWVGILIVAFSLKLLEMHQQKDAYTVIILAYFVALTEFLFEQTIPYALYVYLCISVITAALIGLNQAQTNVRPADSFKRASVILAQSIPLMLVLFVLFPRISPLWTVPLQTNVARTGVTDSMSPGDIAELVQSDELAFRATFEGDIPSYSDLYWRGLVLSRFEGATQTWTHEATGLYGPPLRNGGPVVNWQDNMQYVGEPTSYSIIMEPTQQNWIFSLTLPQLPESEEGIGLVRDFRFYSYNRIASRFRYELTSYLDYVTDLELTDFWRYRYTLLPENDNPRTKELARSIRADSDNDREYLSNVMRHYATQGYTYTLRPPIVTGDTVDEFLLNSRRGFCEHFAGSFVYLMRAGGVPARVVVGYHGGEFNRRGNYVAVHQFDAHAWAEVWFEGEGWVRVDPTSVVAPERINSGLETAVEGEEFLADIGLSLMKFRSNLLITELRLQLSALNHYWDAWVVGYTPSVQMSLLNNYLGDVDRKTLGMILLGAFFGLLALTGLFLLLKRANYRLPAVEQEYLRFCRILAKQDLAREFGEGPLHYADRVSTERPDLGPGIRAVTDAYVRANYIQDTPDDSDELKRSVRAMMIRA